MKFNFSKPALLFTASLFTFTACKHTGSSSSGDFDVDQATGVQYHYIKHDDKGKRAAIGDYVTLEMIYKNDKDSVLFNTITVKRRPGDTSHSITIPLRKSFNGCLEQGVTLMAPGDSALFRISADSLYLKTFGYKQLPTFIHAGSFVTFYIKLEKIQSQQEVMQQQQMQMQKMQAEMQQHKEQEPADIAKYLADNHVNAKPNKDSIYFLERTAGKGKAIQDGDSLAVNYEGQLLDGTVFDKSANHGGPYKLLYNHDQMPVISGWRFALGTMKEGEKARILLPSSRAYGPTGMRPVIPPYSPLVFTMEVVKVWK